MAWQNWRKYARDLRHIARLRRDGWSVVRIWEHDVVKDYERCIGRIERKILSCVKPKVIMLPSLVKIMRLKRELLKSEGKLFETFGTNVDNTILVL